MNSTSNVIYYWYDWQLHELGVVRIRKDKILTNNFIFIISNSRHRIIPKCIDSILNLKNIEMWQKMHIHQTGNKQATREFYKFQKYFETNILIPPKYNSKLANINHNRMLGYRIAFDLLGADNVIGIEEDTVIAKDALLFSDFVLNEYRNNKRFRGINFGSREINDSVNPKSYSRLRFGIQGQASLLTRNSWNKLPMNKLMNFESGEGWDSPIEFYLKTGFMVTPNSSRILDYGWDSGTHAPKNRSNAYYLSMNKSFLKSQLPNRFLYHHFQIEHKSRLDSIEYLSRDNWLFDLRNRLNSSYWARRLKRFLPKKTKLRIGVKN